jgi:integrase
VRISWGTDGTGKRLRQGKTIYGTKRDAQRYLTDALKRADDGLPVSHTKQTLGAWLTEYFETWCGHLSDRTLAMYRHMVGLYLPPTLLARRLTTITPTEVQKLLNGMTDRGLAPNTVKYVHSVLRAALNRAVELGKLPRNVATLVDLPRKRHSEIQTLTPEQARAFLKAAERDRWYGLWVLMLTTGLRPGEALGVKWSDLDGDRLRVQRSLVRLKRGQWQLADPKTGRSRVVSLPSVAVMALRRHRVKQAEERLLAGSKYEDHGLVFATHFGTPLSLRNTIARHYKPLLRRAALPNLRLYDLRHSAATLLLTAGVHPKVVQERLGHASITLTLDTYSHVQADMQARAAERLDGLLS